jgi:hypothetical protein
MDADDGAAERCRVSDPKPVNPKAATAEPVRIRARKVRSFARGLCSWRSLNFSSCKQHAAPRKMRDRELIQVHVGRPIIVRCSRTARASCAALARAAGAECRMKTHARALFR